MFNDLNFFEELNLKGKDVNIVDNITQVQNILKMGGKLHLKSTVFVSKLKFCEIIEKRKVEMY